MAEYVPDEGYSYKVKKVNETQLRVVTEPEKYNNGYPNWVITDVRFPNEAEAIKEHNGITIRINRGLVERTGKMIQGPEHISETALDDAKFDYVIENNGTIEELIEQVKKILIKEKII